MLRWAMVAALVAASGFALAGPREDCAGESDLDRKIALCTALAASELELDPARWLTVRR